MSGHHRPFRVPSPAAGTIVRPRPSKPADSTKGRGAGRDLLRARRSRFAYPTPNHPVRKTRGVKRIKLGLQAPCPRSRGWVPSNTASGSKE